MQLSSKQLGLGLALATFFLCLPAFYNTVPLIFPDSSAYIYAGFTNMELGPRVWTYGGFVRHVSLAETLWLVVLVQGLMVAISIYLSFKYLFKTKNPWYFLSYILLISSTTAASFHVSRLMPDIFTPLILLHLALLLFAPFMNRTDHLLSSFLLFTSLAMHNSHTLLVILLLISLGLGACFPFIRRWYQQSGLTGRRIGTVVALILASSIFVCSLHWSIGAGFRVTKGGGVFLFARLIDFNIAQDYLEEHCDELDAYICPHRASLKWSSEFLWGNAPSSLKEHGNWTEENEQFYSALSVEILTTPKYLKRYILRSLETTLAQFFYVDYNPISESWHQWMFTGTAEYYPHYKIAIEQGRQARQDYSAADIAMMNHVQYLILLLSILLVLWGFIYAPIPQPIQMAMVLLILGMLVNAFIAAATSGVYDRYQSRVAWLITLPAFWVLCYIVERWQAAKEANNLILPN
jgi:hypothetical protein